jgi:hypothetical protein
MKPGRRQTRLVIPFGANAAFCRLNDLTRRGSGMRTRIIGDLEECWN